MPEKIQFSSSHWVLVIALLIAGFACCLLVEPYINSIVMAFIISILMIPLHEKLDNMMPTHKTSIIAFPHYSDIYYCHSAAFCICGDRPTRI